MIDPEQARSLTITTPDQHCTPDDLSDVILQIRSFYGGEPSFPQSSISDEGIRELIRVAYYASLQPDEGGYPRFRLCFPNDKLGEQGRPILKLRNPIGLTDVRDLKKLLPAVASFDVALRVCERRGELLGDAVIEPPFHGLVVRVDGPGVIRAAEAPDRVARLKHGMIENLRALNDLPSVSSWLMHLGLQLSQTVQERVEAEIGPWEKAAFPEPMWSFARVLQGSVDMGHGGALLVLPDSAHKSLRDGILTLTYPVTGLDLPSALIDSIAPAILARLDAERRDHWTRLHRQGRDTAERVCQQVARLTASDGCVVVDRDLEVLGLAATIDLPDPAPDAIRARFGLRHQSVWKLVDKYPDILAFVISQDGDLRLAPGDGEVFTLFEPVGVGSMSS